MKRRLFTPLLLALLLAGCGPEEEHAPSPFLELQRSLPVQQGVNVIVVSFDALRQDVLGIYGAPRTTSPNIDAFARECTVFDNAYTVAPVTPTSFAAAFTGLLPQRVFHAWNLNYEDTLAKRFTDGGYKTAAFINNLQLMPKRNFHTGFEVYDFHESGHDEKLLESSLQWLRENKDERIFAWIHFLSPHAPYEYRDLAAHLYDETYEGEFEKTTRGRFDTDDPKEIERIKSLYEGEVFYADSLFGQLIEGLRETGLLETSVVVLTSDHGEEFKEHGEFQHDRLTEEHVKIPLLIYHPKVRSYLRSQVLVSNVDFFPTLLSLGGLDLDVEVDGRDLTRVTEDPNWILGVSMTGGKRRWLSVRQGSSKLIRTCLPEEGQVLFDLDSDPGEYTDLSSERPAEAKSLYRDLGTVMGGKPCDVMQAAIRGVEPTVGLTQENIEALKALGYLGD